MQLALTFGAGHPLEYFIIRGMIWGNYSRFETENSSMRVFRRRDWWALRQLYAMFVLCGGGGVHEQSRGGHFLLNELVINDAITPGLLEDIIQATFIKTSQVLLNSYRQRLSLGIFIFLNKNAEFEFDVCNL